MNNSSAGIQSLAQVSLVTYLHQLQKNKPVDTPPSTPKASNFSLDALFPTNSDTSKKSFNFFTYEDISKGPLHRRQPNVMIKNISEIYSFTSEFNSDQISEKTYQEKNRVSKYSSTALSEGPTTNTLKSSEPLENNFNDSVEYAETYTKTKSDENLSTVGFNTQEDLPELTQVGLTPFKTYCYNCKAEIFTSVTIKFPALPFWKALCCFSSLAKKCEAESIKEIQHRCKQCNRVLIRSHFQ